MVWELGGGNPSRLPDFDAVWNGADHSVAWQDNASSPAEVIFGRMGCGCGDVDGDGFTSCAGGDCDDDQSSINPLQPEICGDGVDNDCDGLADCQDQTTCPALGPQPGGVTGLIAESDKESFSWDPVPGADRYDVGRGLVTDLGYEQDTRHTGCFDPDVSSTTTFDLEVPVRREGFYYLVRAEAGNPADCRQGTWGGTERDDVIEACP